MPYFYRRYPYKRRYWRRGGVASSQRNGTRRFKLMVPLEGTGSLPCTGGYAYSKSGGFQPFYTSDSNSPYINDDTMKLGSVVGSPLFQTYCKLYDEVKVDSMKLTLAIVKLPAGASGFKCISAVDRHCTLDDIFVRQGTAGLQGCAESQTRMFTSLQNAKVFRTVWARDLSERTSFVDSTLGSRTIAASGQAPQYTQSGLKDFLEAGSLWGAFYPVINFMFQFGTATTADDTIVFQYTCEYTFTFRNPKFAISSVAKGLDFDTRGVEEPVEEKKSDEMEEVPVLKKKKVVIVEEKEDDDDEELNPLLDESQEPFTAPKPVTLKKAGKKG